MKNYLNLALRALTALSFALVSLNFFQTQAVAAWPGRPITVVVMYKAGGGTDTVIRKISDEMSKATGWKINVINKPGVVGGKATRFILKKKANGYWWLGAANYNKFVRVMGHSDSKA